jgi:hypothetical protein
MGFYNAALSDRALQTASAAAVMSPISSAYYNANGMSYGEELIAESEQPTGAYMKMSSRYRPSQLRRDTIEPASRPTWYYIMQRSDS